MYRLFPPRRPATPEPSREVLLQGPWSSEFRTFLHDIHDHHDFLPHTMSEARVIHSIDNREVNNVDQPVVSYLTDLDDTARRTGRNGRKVLEAVGDIFLESYANAIDESAYSQAIIHKFETENIASRTSFHTAFPVSDWQYDNNTIAQLTALSRRLDVQRQLESTIPPERPIDDLPTVERIDRIQATLGVLTVRGMRHLAREVSRSEHARQLYWDRQVRAAIGHATVRAQMIAGLQELNSL